MKWLDQGRTASGHQSRPLTVGRARSIDVTINDERMRTSVADDFSFLVNDICIFWNAREAAQSSNLKVNLILIF